MYHPISESDDDEYLELFNRGARPVDLGGWRFTSGIDYRIPAGVTLAAGGYLVVAKNPANLQATHPGLTAASTAVSRARHGWSRSASGSRGASALGTSGTEVPAGDDATGSVAGRAVPATKPADRRNSAA
jgi:hypothetical protein